MTASTSPDVPAAEIAASQAIADRIAQRVEEVYRLGEIRTPNRDPYKLTGNITAEQGLMLRDLVVQAKAKRTLEVGMGTGLSGLHLCWGLMLNGGGEHLAVDPFQESNYWQGRGLALRDDLQLQDVFHWTSEPDDQALPRLLAEKQLYDLILIDGDHRFEAAMLDFYYADKLLPVGGVCVVDDADWPGVRRTIHFALRHRSYEIVSEVSNDLGPWTRPWGWKLRARRYAQFRKKGWPMREAIWAKPWQFVALRKVAENDRPEDFWASIE